ncbi:PepSY domain-containing protein [Orrella sp. JC864]|uniref:PepSY domain-containing protein n=1 Tax=Orrella sp. JC864 TaxID=3120298 RepID=UPI0030099E9C
MALRAQARRLTYLVHRWSGVAGCVLMLLWFVSGVTMLFVGYPKLTPGERLAGLPALDAQACCPVPDGVRAALAQGQAVLTSIGGQPHFVVREGAAPAAYPAQDAARPGAAGPAQALAEAASRMPGAALRYGGMVQQDRWTHARGLDAHRPLHKVYWDGSGPHGPGRGTLYISSATGQLVLDAPLSQQRWNYVGAWLHWLYFLGKGADGPLWSWTVIALSALGTLAAASGMVVGLWRWRFRGRYKSGARTPYRQAWMRWHHWAGLLFGALVCTWIFSGLMSMNPLSVFAPGPGAARPDPAAYRGGGQPAPAGPLAEPRSVLRALQSQGFAAVELQWRRLDGRAYVLAYDAQARSRLVLPERAGLAVARQFQPQDVLAAAQRAYGRAPVRSAVIARHDAYYYERHPEAMNGALVRGLPALRLDFDDAGRTRAYIDLRTGELALSLSRAQRAGRWLFNFLHSWDLPAMLRAGPLRDLVLILLSLGGIAVSASAVVIGWRRLRGSGG